MGSVDEALQSTPKSASFTAKLSIIDQTVPLIWTTEVWCFECSDVDAAVGALQKGLDVTVAQLPFLAGNIYEDVADRNCAVISWSQHRPRIVIEQVDPGKLPGIHELRRRKMPLHTIDCDIIPKNAKDHSQEGVSQVVFAVSYAKIEGGLILGLAVQHGFADGFGIQRIWKKWAYNTSNLGQDINIDPREPLTRYESLNRAVRTARERIRAEEHLVTPPDISSTSQDLEPPSDLPTPVLASTAKIFFLSVRKLNRLCEEIRAHISQPFSRNTLIAALLWQTISVVRSKRLSKIIDLSRTNATSELMLVVDSRGILEDVLPGAKDWLGNMALQVLPAVTFPLRAFNSHPIDLVQQDLTSSNSDTDGSETLWCPQSLPRILKRLASTYSKYALPEVVTSLGQKLDKIDSPGFDFRSLRMPETTLNGLQVIVTNVSNFDAWNDFGPLLGRPLFTRHGSRSIDGMVIVMPLRKGANFTEQERDEMEIMVFMREDDLQALTVEEAWRQLWCADPI